MKIVATSHYGDESFEEYVIYEHLHPWIAKWMLGPLQGRFDDRGPAWPVIVEDDQPLWRGLEEFV